MTESKREVPQEPRTIIHAYHQRTKHRLDRYAAGPGSLDWDAQPDPFRRWQGTRCYELTRALPETGIAWADLQAARESAPFEIDRLGQFLRLSAAITAWKQYGPSRWSLRAHPSSGNLHPTETWVIAYWVDGIADGLYHYQASDHSLEWRASTVNSPDSPGLWLGFSSIAWREAWKYGERAFRYCQLDMGHVLAAMAYAAAVFGWRPRLVNLSPEDTAHSLGLDRKEDFAGVEAEDAEVIIAMHGVGEASLPPLEWDEWSGVPSLLDPRPMYQWPVIDEVMLATRGALPQQNYADRQPGPACPSTSTRPVEEVLLKRRSAQAFDGRSLLPNAVFRRILAALLPGGSPVWEMWTLAPRVHPVLLVHRVEDVAPGLYALPRSADALASLRAAMRAELQWTELEEERESGLPLYRLLNAKAERTARTVSCHQDIASHSAFTIMFVAEFSAPIESNPAAWRHLHWEAGMLGHCATLEAEAAGWRGTGIGCFFDDADHEILGLGDTRYQVIYHYAIGMPVDDPRLSTLPAYE